MGNFCSSCFKGQTTGPSAREEYEVMDNTEDPPRRPNDVTTRRQTTNNESNLSQEERRRQAAEAAEARLNAQERRGIQDVESVRRNLRKKEEMERREMEFEKNNDAGPGLRWQVG